MNRNTNAHFSQLPAVDIQRSTFDRSHSYKTSGNVGDIIPIYVDADIMPGDTVSMDTAKLIRFQTLLTPMMDNIQADIYWFFVPHRLVWDHWINFMGENTDSAWTPDVEYTVPKIRVPANYNAATSNKFSMNRTGTILDYMGFPVGMNPRSSTEINALPIRAYAKVFNEWFRSENLTDPVNIYTGDATQVAMTEAGEDNEPVYNYIHDVPLGGFPAKAAKYADYFTSLLPAPQKGDAVSIQINSSADFLPVYPGTENIGYPSASGDPPLNNLVFLNDVNNKFSRLYRVTNNGNLIVSGNFDNFSEALSSPAPTGSGLVYPANLWADANSFRGSFTVNDMRYAFQLQKLLERDARGGTRYIETIKSHFGVTSPDARLQRPEYLGGNRFSIVIDQVLNNAQSEQDFLGDVGAMSVTSDVHSDFTHSFTEHGTLLSLMVLRYDHTYSQGLHRMWFRDDRFSYYWPVFANIGEQPVYKDEIYLADDPTGSKVGPTKTVMGYNEAWAEYRYFPNMVTGEMRPYVENGLFSWSLADQYSEQPTLSDQWLREDKSNVDRVLAVTSQAANQFWADIYFSAKYTRPMPVYSIPGLIDHH